MSEPARSGMQVERVLEDLIARLSQTDPSKEVRAALIEARRLRSVTLTWTAIPPPVDARREMLTKVLGLVARVGAGAAPRSSAEVRAEAFATFSPPSPGASSADPIPRRPTTPPPPAVTRHSTSGKAPSTPPPPPPPEETWSTGAESRRRPRSDSDLPPASLHIPPLSLPSFERGLPGVERGRPDDSAHGGGGEPASPSASGARLSAHRSPVPFRRAPSAQDFAAVRPTSIKAVGHEGAMRHGSSEEKPRRAFGSGQATQTSMSRPLRTAMAAGVSLVRPQATAWQAYPRVAGAKLKLLWRDAESGAYTALLHLAPGTTLPPRRHAAVEEMLLVEGAAFVGSYEMRAGEYSRAEAGSVHDPIKSDDGCTFFVTGSEKDELVEDGGA